MIRVGKYGIDASDRCYEVGKIGKITDKKTGEEKEHIVNPSYFPTIQGALKHIRKKMHFETVKNMDGDIQSAIEALRKTDEHFEKLISIVEVEG